VRYLPVIIPRHLSPESAVLTQHCRKVEVIAYLQDMVSDTQSQEYAGFR
jgi:hypothetical protein